MTHKDRYESACAAVQAIFGDMSVSQEQTLESLRSLVGEIEICIDAIESDLERTAESDRLDELEIGGEG